MTVDTNPTFSGELARLNRWQQFRLVYRSPENAAAPYSTVWIGPQSAAFSNRVAWILQATTSCRVAALLAMTA